jgi:hypothetical protein
VLATGPAMLAGASIRARARGVEDTPAEAEPSAPEPQERA